MDAYYECFFIHYFSFGIFIVSLILQVVILLILII